MCVGSASALGPTQVSVSVEDSDAAPIPWRSPRGKTYIRSVWAEDAIEKACVAANEWYRALPVFERRVNLGSVVGFKHPALMSEHDCVGQFAWFIHEAGVPWDAIHHEVSDSRWLFDIPHPAASNSFPDEHFRVSIRTASRANGGSRSRKMSRRSGDT